MIRDFKANNIENIISGEFTIKYPNGEHRTITLRHSDESFFHWENQGTLLLGILRGSDNENDYQYIARIFPKTGKVEFFAKFAQPNQNRLPYIVRALEIAATWKQNPIEGKAYALKSERCVRCNRKLTNPDTLEQCEGYGPICFEKIFGKAA